MATTIWYIVASATFLLHITGNSHTVQGAPQYLGKFLGKLSELHHGVSGEVYAVDGRTIHIKDFTYDGEGPAAYFFAGNSRIPSKDGFRIRDEKGNPAVLRRYRREPVTLTLPEGKNLNNIKWFSVWCEEFEVNFGDIKIPRNFDFPRPQKLGKLSGIHGVSSDNVVIVDAQTLLIPNFSYDGEAPDAKFWVGRGLKPSPQGIRVPDENGKEVPLRRYDRKTVVLTLPSDMTVFDIGHFGVWCEAFTVDFGHVQIPQNLNVPPSLKMLGVSPQSKLNCEVLHDNLAFEVRWAVAGDSIVMQLVAKLENREYMSFGISGDNSRSVMVGGDVAVAWIDKDTLKGYAEDYFLDAKSQCSGPKGSCPDEKLREKSGSIRLLNAAMVNGYSIVTYQRPLKAQDELDRPIFTNQSQAIIWAIGPLNQREEVSFHSEYTKGDQFLDFGRPPKWNCPMPEGSQPPMKVTAPIVEESSETVTEAEVAPVEPTRTRNDNRRRGDSNSNRGSNANRGQSQRRGSRPTTTTTEKPSTTTAAATPRPAPKHKPWVIPPIECYEPEDGLFYAQMGPTGGKHGYPAITGHVGWGISWYINGLLIPEVNVVRGKTYTFFVEGGLDPEVPAKYHPFYITDDPIGGFEHKTEEERQNVTVFAGVKQLRDGTVLPTGVGRLCNWTPTADNGADDYESFGAYQRTLELRCDPGEPGVISWTPDKETPDTVYYQCFTHRYLGWKINVHDACDQSPEGSAPEPAISLPDDEAVTSEDLSDSPSLFVETRVKYNDLTSSSDIKKYSAKIPSKNQFDSEKPVSEESYEDAPSNFGEPILVDSVNMYPQSADMNNPIFYAAAPEISGISQYGNNFKASPMDGNKVHGYGFKETATETTTTKSPATTIAIMENVTPPKKLEYLDKTPNNMQVRPVLIPTLKIPQKPVLSGNKIIYRRPIPQYIQNRPPFAATPYMTANNRQVPPNISPPFKKPVYRPMNKRPILMGGRPAMMPVMMGNKPKHQQMQHHQIRPQNVVILQQQQQQQQLSNVAQAKEQQHAQQPNVQISPQQASTEKEPETGDQASFATLLSAVPNYDSYTTMKPAVNTGFHPESVIIEGGFLPIINKEIEERMSHAEDDGPELEYESEIGVIDVNAAEKMANEEKTVQTFGPMFIPSPLDNPQPAQKNASNKHLKRAPYKSKPQVMRVIKHGRSNAEAAPEAEGDSGDDDEIAMAAEKVESFYLPPEGRSLNFAEDSAPVAPGRVVTYDGRTVSGASLSGPLSDPAAKFDARGSKASEFLRARPQFVPFSGELPPLNAHVANTNLAQFSSRGATINRDLQSPVPTGSTKLTAVKNRDKRSAHHTEEHTAQQKHDADHHNHDHSAHNPANNTTNSSAATVLYSETVLLTIVFLCLSKIM